MKSQKKMKTKYFQNSKIWELNQCQCQTMSVSDNVKKKNKMKSQRKGNLKKKKDLKKKKKNLKKNQISNKMKSKNFRTEWMSVSDDVRVRECQDLANARDRQCHSQIISRNK